MNLACPTKKTDIKRWYNGFTFGKHTDIYNPWSILNYLDKKHLATYWANTSSNSLAGKLLREGNRRIKTSNRESGFGRYDVMLEPREKRDDAMILEFMPAPENICQPEGITSERIGNTNQQAANECAHEYKVQDTESEKDLSATVQEALKQIERKKYETVLTEKGIPQAKIRKYGFAFQGKRVLIGKAESKT